MNTPKPIDLEETHQLPVTGDVRFECNKASRTNVYLFIGFMILALLAVILVEGRFHLQVFLVMVGAAAVGAVLMELVLHQAKNRAVVLDFDRNIVVLEGFVYPRSFWDVRRKPEVMIPFNEVLSVEKMRGKVEASYLVYTKDTRFSIASTLDRHDELADILEQIAQGTEQLHPIRSFWITGILAGFLGLGVVALWGRILGLI